MLGIGASPTRLGLAGMSEGSASRDVTERASGELTMPQAGDRIDGKYVVGEPIGEGGMGIVFGGEHARLRQAVAIKVLAPKYAADAQCRARFLREARAAASLRSERTVRIFDVGTTESDLPFLVMERLVGESLEARLERGILPVDVALDICGQALEALSEAHTRGLVHRDLKPGNLFLTPKDDGAVAVKVLDFGIAKSLTEVDASTSDVSLTAPRTLLGSPLYMSPEQLRDASGVDVRADVWAMGVVLFECLTGRAPFESASVPELYAKILNEAAPSVRSLVPGVPAAVDALVARCLEKDRSARFADATELARAIQALPRDRSAFVDTLPAGARTLSEMPRGRVWAVRVGAVAALVVAAAAGITVYRGQEEAPRPTPSPSAIPEPRASDSVAPTDRVSEPSASPPAPTFASAKPAKADAVVLRDGGPTTAKPTAPRRVNDLKQIKLIE